LGWVSRAAAFASRTNRSTASRFRANFGDMIFTATIRSALVCRARKTVPIDPAPISFRT
jgi:hypothetical protein